MAPPLGWGEYELHISRKSQSSVGNPPAYQPSGILTLFLESTHSPFFMT